MTPRRRKPPRVSEAPDGFAASVETWFGDPIRARDKALRRIPTPARAEITPNASGDLVPRTPRAVTALSNARGAMLEEHRERSRDWARASKEAKRCAVLEAADTLRRRGEREWGLAVRIAKFLKSKGVDISERHVRRLLNGESD